MPKHQLIKRKVIIIIDDYSASASEFIAIALKNNPNVTLVGRPTAGFTTANISMYLNNKKGIAIIPVAKVKANRSIAGKQIFNNEPIQPDKTTMYQPRPSYTSSKQEPLDKDFLAEVYKKVY